LSQLAQCILKTSPKFGHGREWREMAEQQVIEGTWEEIASHAGELAASGKRLKLIIPADEPRGGSSPEARPDGHCCRRFGNPVPGAPPPEPLPATKIANFRQQCPDGRAYFGMFKGPSESTEEDFKEAEFHGDPDTEFDGPSCCTGCDG